jgi:hypothetical protein
MIHAANNKCERAWNLFRDVIGAKEIIYNDLGSGGENYIIQMPNGKSVTLRARGNKFDGAFLNLDISE